MSFDIRPATQAHWLAMHEVFARGITSGQARFEAEPPAWSDWDTSHRPNPRLVAFDGQRAINGEQAFNGGEAVGPVGPVLGWAAVSQVSDRPVFAGVVELSIYVDPDHQGKGVGFALLTALIKAATADGIWTIQSGVFPENTTSLRLHERAGFRVVGVRERLGLMTYGPMAGQWRDVVLLEHRA